MGYRRSLIAGALSLICALPLTTATAQSRDGGALSSERVSMAKGHYSRAQALLAAAIREFDRGSEIASADVVLDSKQWRDTIVARAEDLERLLDPQPRASRGGVRYDSDTRLLNEKSPKVEKKSVKPTTEEPPLGS